MRTGPTKNNHISCHFRSIPEPRDSVGDWLNHARANGHSSHHIRGSEGTSSTVSPSSSFAEITSMSDMETPSASTLNIDSCGSDEHDILRGEGRDKIYRVPGPGPSTKRPKKRGAKTFFSERIRGVKTFFQVKFSQSPA